MIDIDDLTDIMNRAIAHRRNNETEALFELLEEVVIGHLRKLDSSSLPFCRNGHLRENNTYINSRGHKICKTCQQIQYTVDRKSRTNNSQTRSPSGDYKLSWHKVKIIRSIYHSAESVSYRELANRYNVSPQAISDIINNRTWFDTDYRPEMI